MSKTVDELLREFEESFRPSSEIPKVMLVEEALQQLYYEKQDIELLEVAISRINEEIGKVNTEIIKYQNLIIWIKPYEDVLIKKKNEAEKEKRKAMNIKRTLVAESALMDLDITKKICCVA